MPAVLTLLILVSQSCAYPAKHFLRANACSGPEVAGAPSPPQESELIEATECIGLVNSVGPTFSVDPARKFARSGASTCQTLEYDCREKRAGDAFFPHKMRSEPHTNTDAHSGVAGGSLQDRQDTGGKSIPQLVVQHM